SFHAEGKHSETEYGRFCVHLHTDRADVSEFAQPFAAASCTRMRASGDRAATFKNRGFSDVGGDTRMHRARAWRRHSVAALSQRSAAIDGDQARPLKENSMGMSTNALRGSPSSTYGRKAAAATASFAA